MFSLEKPCTTNQECYGPWPPGGCFNTKIQLCQYRNSHCKNWSIFWLSYLQKGFLILAKGYTYTVVSHFYVVQWNAIFACNTLMAKHNKILIKKTHHKDHLQVFTLYLYIKSSFLQLCNVCQRVSAPLAAFCYKLWHSVRCVPWSHTKGDVFKTVKYHILLIQ